ncbi:TonB-dependent receptor [Flammeovirga yaeyamensis]|uniref:TonB-dependent receptor n=1 Tax=Flammeovirga yaeyamensis TaxID=367791 RepID=A0AAX1NB24_9BACT|nr:TonB-dependent receptor [Flammeovirga yaeyamensis]MBB3697859.1 hypothetical protein [Flammeovirga yaeyamensis]NMF35786.1 TonB-dependent receptor [Flammeovirga yaeyamensis]QWG03262.1 TonB-dependent receptor [Flammeovirga yaeyamensis]
MKTKNILLGLASIACLTLNNVNAQGIKSDSAKVSTKENNALTKQINVFESGGATNDVPRELNTGVPSISLKQVYNDSYFDFNNGTAIAYRNFLLSGKRSQAERGESVIEYGYSGFVVNYEPVKVGNFLKGTISGSTRGTRYIDVQAMHKIGKKGWYAGLGLVNKQVDGPFHYADGWIGTNGQNYAARVGKEFKNGEFHVDVFHNDITTNTTKQMIFLLDKDGNVQNTNFSDYNNLLLPASQSISYVDPFSGELIHKNDVLGTRIQTTGIDANFDYKFANDWKLHFVARYENSYQTANFNKALTVPKTANEYGDKYAGMMGMSPGSIYFQNANTGEKINGGDYLIKERYQTLYHPENFQHWYNTTSMSKQFGDHTLKFGMNLQYVEFPHRAFIQQQGLYAIGDGSDIQAVDIVDNTGKVYTKGGIINYNGQIQAMDEVSSFTTSFYAHDIWKITDRFSVDYGYRFDIFMDKYNKIIDGTPDIDTTQPLANQFVTVKTYQTPAERLNYNQVHVMHSAYLGFVYQLNNWRFDGSASKGFMPQRITIAGIKPDRNFNSDQVNEVYVGQFNVGYIKSKYGVRTGINYITKTNDYEAISLPDGTSQGVPHDITTFGYNVNVFAKPLKNWNVAIQYTYQEPKYKNYELPTFDGAGNPTAPIIYSDNMPTGIAKHIIEFNTNYSITPKLKVNGLVRYQSRKALDKKNVFYSAPYLFTQAGVSYKLTKHFSLSYKMLNVLNRTGASSIIGLPNVNKDDTQVINNVYTNPMIGTIQAPREHVFTLKFNY